MQRPVLPTLETARLTVKDLHSLSLMHGLFLSERRFGQLLSTFAEHGALAEGNLSHYSRYASRQGLAALCADFPYNHGPLTYSREGVGDGSGQDLVVRRVNFARLADPARALRAMTNLCVWRHVLTREKILARGVRVGLAGDSGDEKCRIMMVLSDVDNPGSPYRRTFYPVRVN